MKGKQKAEDDATYKQHQQWARNFARTFYERDGGNARLEALRARGRTDWDVLKENHRFLRNGDAAAAASEGNASSSKLPYEELVALKYYNQLYKEYAVIDLKHFKSGDIALRWRTEDELIDGIGQFTCGGIRCDNHKRLPSTDGLSTPLTTYQLDFAYMEAGDDEAAGGQLVQKQALVKVVLCPRCAKKLNWKREHDKKERQGSASRSSERRREGSHDKKRHNANVEDGRAPSRASKRRRSRSWSPPASHTHELGERT